MGGSNVSVGDNCFVHESSYVDDNVEIGEGTRVWHFCHILSGTKIGQGCVIGQNCAVGPDVVVGDRCKLQNNVSLFKGVTLEEEVFCGPSCVFTNVLNPRAFIERKQEFRRTLVRRGATIGANATIICGVTIGRYAMIGAGAVVSTDVPDYALLLGVPGRQVGWVSRHGRSLPPPDESGITVCPESSWRYREVEPGLLRCLDRAEDEPFRGEKDIL
jgi:UDP-2-acetamido-3-amino-2,3-dideoxy-glucuronate N-acetyltransferase